MTATSGTRLLLLTASEVRAPHPVVARALASVQDGTNVTLLCLAASDQREEADLGGVHVIRVPLSTAYRDALAKRRARRRRMRRVAGYASQDELRLARLRADLHAEEATYAASAGQQRRARWHSLAGRSERFLTRARPALQRRADRLQRAAWRAVDRLPKAPSGLPDLADLELTFGADIDEISPDVIEAIGLDVVPVAARAVARARGSGRASTFRYLVRPDLDVAGRARRTIERRYVASATQTIDMGGIATSDLSSDVVERPYRVDRGGRSLLAIGPANMAGQGWAWGQAVVRNCPNVDVEVFMVDRGTLAFPADVVISAADFAHSSSWQLRWARHLRTEATHVLMEAGRPVMGRLNGGFFADDVPHLRAAGIAVGLVFHGSEIRDPARHAQLYPWSPFTDPDEELTHRLQRQIAELAPLVEAFDGPKFVSTPDLLDDVPEASWLPVVVDLDVWVPGEAPLQRERPLVVHAPSRRALKGTALIEPVLEELVARGRIDYQRIEGVPNRDVPALIRAADIVLDHFGIGNYGVLTCEAMASGRVSISHIHDRVRARVADRIPTLEATPDTLAAVIEQVLDDRDAARELAASGPAFVREWHDGRRSAAALADFLGCSDSTTVAPA